MFTDPCAELADPCEAPYWCKVLMEWREGKGRGAKIIGSINRHIFSLHSWRIRVKTPIQFCNAGRTPYKMQKRAQGIRLQT